MPAYTKPSFKENANKIYYIIEIFFKCDSFLDTYHELVHFKAETEAAALE